MSVATELTKLNNQRIALAENLTAKGVTASGTETLTELVPKVLNIVQGGGSTEGFVSVRSATLNPVVVTALTCNLVLPTNMAEGDMILIGFFVRSAVTLPTGYTLIDNILNNDIGQNTCLIYKIATAADIGATVTIAHATSGRLNASAVILRSSTGFAIDTSGKTNDPATPVAPALTATNNNSIAVLVGSSTYMLPNAYAIQGNLWLTTTTLNSVTDLRLMMAVKPIYAGESTSGGAFIFTSRTHFAQVAVIISPT